MGKLVEQTAKEMGHKIACIIDIDSLDNFKSNEFRTADVAIEFTTPSTAVTGILECFAAGVPVVSGTTGWGNSLPDIKAMCLKGAGTLLHASNFSIGMNIFMAINQRLAAVMNDFPAYKPHIHETHHIHKLDHPSGTAISLANQMIEYLNDFKGWEEPEDGEKVTTHMLPISCTREGEVNGIHTVTWDSDADTISMTHEAKSRIGFARGAVKAAEWIHGKKGYFTMQDMLADVTGIQGLFK